MVAAAVGEVLGAEKLELKEEPIKVGVGVGPSPDGKTEIKPSPDGKTEIKEIGKSLKGGGTPRTSVGASVGVSVGGSVTATVVATQIAKARARIAEENFMLK